MPHLGKHPPDGGVCDQCAREKYVLIIGRVVHLEADDRFISLEKGMDFEKAMLLCIVGSGDAVRPPQGYGI